MSVSFQGTDREYDLLLEAAGGGAQQPDLSTALS